MVHCKQPRPAQLTETTSHDIDEAFPLSYSSCPRSLLSHTNLTTYLSYLIALPHTNYNNLRNSRTAASYLQHHLIPELLIINKLSIDHPSYVDRTISSRLTINNRHHVCRDPRTPLQGRLCRSRPLIFTTQERDWSPESKLQCSRCIQHQ